MSSATTTLAATETTDTPGATAAPQLELYPSPGTFTVGAHGLAESLCYSSVDDLAAALPRDSMRLQTVRTAQGERDQLVITEPGFYQAIGMRALRPVVDDADCASIERFVAWVDSEVLPLLCKATAPTGVGRKPKRLTMTKIELAAALHVRQRWGWSRAALGRHLSAAGVIGPDGRPIRAWRDSFACDERGWALYADAVPHLEQHLVKYLHRTAQTGKTPPKGPDVHTLVSDRSWRTPFTATEAAADADEQKASLVDDLMGNLPGPDGKGRPLGITWLSGRAVCAPVLRDRLPGFARGIRPDVDDLAFRKKLASKVWDLREYGDSMGFGAAVTSRIVYDFLISVVYGCETRS